VGSAIVTLLGVISLRNTGAQTQLVSRDFFPAELEFKELQRVNADKSGDGLSSLPDGRESPIFAEAGFLHYARRVYVTDAGSELSIEILTAKDEKAAYSLLTLLRGSRTVPGPPGDEYAAIDGGLILVKGSFWVRIRGSSSADLYRRIALSISNRIGERAHAVPSLILRLPQSGLEPDSLRYFLGPISLESYGTGISGGHSAFGPEVEIAQAHYKQGGADGVLSLIAFPTGEAAESYFEKVSATEGSTVAQAAIRRYAKKVGPIVGVLQGVFDPAAANDMLKSL